VSKLLVPLDGSPSALRALEHAIARASADPGSSIQLVTAHERIVSHPEIGVVYHSFEERLARQRDESAAILAAGERMLKEAGLPHTTEVLTGPVARSIVERAEALACDGIVMGTRGMGAAANLVLGSVSTQVVHGARVPVTLVK
jgi:nucleotide-binding universal stress UspA family protein